MRYRKLNPSGDYQFGNSLNDFYIDVPAAVGQAVQTRLELWQGEWFLDSLEGTPYMEGVIGKHSQASADAVVQGRALNTEGVSDISTFQSSVDPSTRAYSVTMTIDTIYGPTAVQIANAGNF